MAGGKGAGKKGGGKNGKSHVNGKPKKEKPPAPRAPIGKWLAVAVVALAVAAAYYLRPEVEDVRATEILACMTNKNCTDDFKPP